MEGGETEERWRREGEREREGDPEYPSLHRCESLPHGASLKKKRNHSERAVCASTMDAVGRDKGKEKNIKKLV